MRKSSQSSEEKYISTEGAAEKPFSRLWILFLGVILHFPQRCFNFSSGPPMAASRKIMDALIFFRSSIGSFEKNYGCFNFLQVIHWQP